MKLNFFLWLFFLAVLLACKNKNEGLSVKSATKDPVPATSVKNGINNTEFASKKDVTCGMPLSTGITDTAHYKGKVYGFCSDECKSEFLKDPERYQ